MHRTIRSWTRRTCAAGLFVLVVTEGATAQQPRITGARFQQRTVSAGLQREFNAIVGAEAGPAWIGYSVPVVPVERVLCCSGGSTDVQTDAGACDPCALEDRHASTTAGPIDPAAVRLEGAQSVLVLFRVEGRKVGSVRVFSDDCPLDGGGLPFIWLTGVRPSDSVGLLSALVAGAGVLAGVEDRVSRSVVTAIGLHDDPSAVAALQRFVAPGQPLSLRKHAAFWLGSARGRQGFDILRALMHDEPSAAFRKDLVFPIAESPVPESVPLLIQVARDDTSADVRGQALFWLAQKAGVKAIGTLTGAIDHDPDTEVKKRAVFGLSRLPKGEGVPLLIDVARNNRNAAVRTQAMFWLGQSKDPRALAFFEQILTR
ncbi:MAG: HEAT repeat domain-containing protein [Planctomycetes bacterium]|nr:HEAT repeat domain-containing protein [Planctomycetota bacterium]